MWVRTTYPKAEAFSILNTPANIKRGKRKVITTVTARPLAQRIALRETGTKQTVIPVRWDTAS